MSRDEKHKFKRWQSLQELGMSSKTFESCEREEKDLARIIDLSLSSKTYHQIMRKSLGEKS